MDKHEAPTQATEESPLQKSLYQLNDSVVVLEKLKSVFEDRLGRLLRPTSACVDSGKAREQPPTSQAVSELDGVCLRLINIGLGFADILDRYEG